MAARQDSPARGWRIGLTLLGMALLADVVMLLIVRVFNVGVLLPALMGIGLLVLAWRWPALQRWRRSSRWRGWIWRVACLSVIAWILSVGYFFWLIQQADDDAESKQTPRVILVLGSGSPNCAASPTLSSRLEEGLKQAQRWPQARVVVSGGVDFGLDCSEASVMADYMVARGFDRSRLLLEERSTSTETNLKFSRALLEQNGIGVNEPVILVTSDFHLLRAKRIASKVGFSTVAGAAAPTPLYIRYNAWLREYCATLSSWVLGEF